MNDDPFDTVGYGIEKASQTFRASYRSECPAGDTVEEYDEVVMYDGEAWHVDCYDRDTEGSIQ